MHYAYCYKCQKHLIVESDLSPCQTCQYEVVLLSASGMQQYTTKRRILAGITGATKRPWPLP